MFVGSTAKPVTRPEVNAGPIERILSPLNVGVDIGSRGVGDASGVGVGEGLAVAVGDGDGVAGGRGGSCATTRNGSRNRSEITVNTHEDMVINSSLFFSGKDREFRVQALACLFGKSSLKAEL